MLSASICDLGHLDDGADRLEQTTHERRLLGLDAASPTTGPVTPSPTTEGVLGIERNTTFGTRASMVAIVTPPRR